MLTYIGLCLAWAYCLGAFACILLCGCYPVMLALSEMRARRFK
jgi:hypothetical protein